MKAAIYARYSSDNQREESIDAQIRAITDFAMNNGYTITCTYVDEALSAKSDNRPRFLQMIDDAKTGKFEVILCHKLDRFARNRYDSAFYKKLLKENGVRLISVLENFDDSPESIILESVLEGMAEYYSANLAREVMKGLKENALECKHTGGKPPFGYDVDPNKRYIINKKESEAIKEIFDRTVRKETTGSIVQWLNSNGYRTKYGTLFNTGTINNIIRNEKYMGTYVYGKNKRIKENGILKDIPNNDVIKIENGIQSIVSKETWKQANSIYDERILRPGDGAKAKEIYLLSGIIKCGQCGKAMSGNKVYSGRGKNLRITYRCSTRKKNGCCNAKEIRKDLVEDIVLTEIERICCPENINKIVDYVCSEAAKELNEIPVLIKEYKHDLSQLDIQINNILDMIMSGVKSSSLKDRLESLEDKKRDLIDKVSYMETHSKSLKLNREFVFKHLAKYEKIKQKSDELKKKAINSFVHKVTVYEDHVEVISDMDTDSRGSAPLLESMSNMHLTSTYYFSYMPNVGYDYKYISSKIREEVI